ncbi:MAG TPA: hypothetical protein VMZ30_11775 [Pyrinomonadaceae bacterium]|nr:hypothetical protein [Pyrinomonadaceae bacterium]
MRVPLFFVEPFFELRLEAAVFLDAERFELAFEADLFGFFRAVFFAGMVPPVNKISTRSNAPPTYEEALPAVDDALASPPGPFKKPAQKRSGVSILSDYYPDVAVCTHIETGAPSSFGNQMVGR